VYNGPLVNPRAAQLRWSKGGFCSESERFKLRQQHRVGVEGNLGWEGGGEG
jgi:hypothetical protein